jgi:hypothetical protein
MQPSDIIDIQRRISQLLAAELPRGWTSYELHYENFAWKSEQIEKYTSECSAGSKPVRFDPSLEAIDALVELQDGMGQQGSERWSSVDVRLHPDGNFAFSFGYGVPPLVAEALRSSGEVQ